MCAAHDHRAVTPCTRIASIESVILSVHTGWCLPRGPSGRSCRSLFPQTRTVLLAASPEIVAGFIVARHCCINLAIYGFCYKFHTSLAYVAASAPAPLPHSADLRVLQHGGCTRCCRTAGGDFSAVFVNYFPATAHRPGSRASTTTCPGISSRACCMCDGTKSA